MKNIPTISWLCSNKEQAEAEYDRLINAGFSAMRPRGCGLLKIVVIGYKGQQDLFERIEKALNDKCEPSH